ncbi:hypothetical protein EV182_008121, partial [Spiromyces aspiralis]
FKDKKEKPMGGMNRDEYDENAELQDNIFIFQLPRIIPQFSLPHEGQTKILAQDGEAKGKTADKRTEIGTKSSGTAEADCDEVNVKREQVPDTPSSEVGKENMTVDGDVKPKIEATDGVITTKEPKSTTTINLEDDDGNNNKGEDTKSGADANAENTAKTEGQIGTLKLYKSGKVKLDIGGILFDITAGSECHFVQKLVALDTKKRQAFALGNITKRF